MNGEHLFRILSIQPRADPEDEVKTPDWGQLALMFKNVKNNDFRSTERFSREIVRIEKQKELDYARLATFLVHLGRVEMPEYAISLVPKISLECLSSLIVEWAKNRIFRPSFIERIFEMTQEEYLGDPTLAVRKPEVFIDLFWAFERLKIPLDDTFRHRVIQINLERLDALTMSRSLDALVETHERTAVSPPQSYFNSFWQLAVAKLTHFSPNDLARVLWGSRHFKGQFEIALGEVSARRFTTEVKQMTLQNLNLVNPDGLLRYMDVIGTPIPEKDKIRGKILVSMEHDNKLAKFTSSQLGDVIWRFTNEKKPVPGPILTKLTACAIKSLQTAVWEPYPLAKLIWSYARIVDYKIGRSFHPGNVLLDAFKNALIPVLKSHNWQKAGRVGKDNARHLSNFVWAFSVLEYNPGDDFMALYCSVVENKLSSFSSSNLSDFVLGLGWIGYATEKIAKILRGRLSHLINRKISRNRRRPILCSLARLHVLPPHDFIRTVLSDTRNIDDLPEVLFAAWKFREMELRGAIKNVQVTEQKTFLGYQNWSAKRTETEVDKFFQVSSVDMADSLLEHAASRVDSSSGSLLELLRALVAYKRDPAEAFLYYFLDQFPVKNVKDVIFTDLLGMFRKPETSELKHRIYNIVIEHLDGFSKEEYIEVFHLLAVSQWTGDTDTAQNLRTKMSQCFEIANAEEFATILYSLFALQWIPPVNTVFYNSMMKRLKELKEKDQLHGDAKNRVSFVVQKCNEKWNLAEALEMVL